MQHKSLRRDLKVAFARIIRPFRKDRLSAKHQEDTTTPLAVALADPVLPTLPVEVWERVIDFLWDNEYTLRSCSRVCKLWAPRSHLRLHGAISFGSAGEVYRAARYMRTRPSVPDVVWKVKIEDARVLHVFAAVFAGKLTKMDELVIDTRRISAKTLSEEPRALHSDTLLHLSAYSSVTRLKLWAVTIKTEQAFGRLLHALPNLVDLDCHNVAFSTHAFNAEFFTQQAYRTPRLTSLCLTHYSWQMISMITEFLVDAAFCDRLEQITLWLPQRNEADMIGTQRLLNATSTSLRELMICPDVDSPPSMSQIDQHMNILSNITLRSLSLWMYPLENWSWVPHFLSQLSSEVISEVVFTIPGFDSYAADRMRVPHSTECCSRIDDILSGTRFTRLDSVVFQLRALPLISEIGKLEALSLIESILSQFPRLQGQGKLRHSIEL